jgi:hypothetical protein
MVSEIMRANGYYCTNNSKEDYQFYSSKMAWDESSIHAHWRNRPEGKPFYAVFNFGVTHESNTWNPYGRPYDLDVFPPERGGDGWWKQFEGKKKPLFVFIFQSTTFSSFTLCFVQNTFNIQNA